MNCQVPTRVFTSYRIKAVVFQMILVCEVVFGHFYRVEWFHMLSDVCIYRPLLLSCVFSNETDVNQVNFRTSNIISFLFHLTQTSSSLVTLSLSNSRVGVNYMQM